MILRHFNNLKFAPAGVFFTPDGSKDLKGENTNESFELYTRLSGWERVKLIFARGEDYSFSPQFQGILNMTCMGGFLGFMYGALIAYKEAALHFIETNDVTKFLNMHEAKRKMINAGTVAFLSGGLQVAPKTLFYTGIFMSTYAVTNAYRGKNGIIEYSAAGAVSSMLYKWNLGIRGMFSGFVTGGVIGTLIGLPVFAYMKLTGFDLSDAFYAAYLLSKQRKDLMHQKGREAVMADPSFIEHHYAYKTELLPADPDPVQDQQTATKRQLEKGTTETEKLNL